MMETKETTLKLGGKARRLTVTQLPAMRGMRLLARLSNLAGPGLAVLASGDKAQISEAVRELLAKVTETEVEHLIRELGETATIELENGEARPLLKVFDSEFAGEPGAVIAFVVHALGVNFGNFREGLGDLFAPFLAKVAALQSKGSNTSAGPQNG